MIRPFRVEVGGDWAFCLDSADLDMGRRWTQETTLSLSRCEEPLVVPARRDYGCNASSSVQHPERARRENEASHGPAASQKDAEKRKEGGRLDES
ncbi:hypothetical protein CCHR01_08202 [Colletotrichum chrysophilum]|uniref:Uncharacterized protein n=1 Tax=Colletotrichum chrysophilum TaxID=1836956 RepID=A0AAD9AKA1_9PEZI|nr:hypothetical protein CCHR01_08202 [Colletotrichum chrysophilum]